MKHFFEAALGRFVLTPEFQHERKRLRFIPNNKEKVNPSFYVPNNADGARLLKILAEDLHSTLPQGFAIEAPINEKRLMPHQRKAVAKMLAYRQLGLFLEMGLGKTLTNLYAFSLFPVGPKFIVCPRPLFNTWLAEIKRWSKVFGFNFRPVVLGEKYSMEERANLLEMTHDPSKNILYITNYETFRKESAVTEKIKELGLRFQACTLDESVHIKNTETKAWQGLYECAKFFERRYLLSGIPAPQGLADYVGQMAFLHPALWGYASNGAFINDYGKRDQWTQKITSFYNAEKWHKRVHECALVLKKEDVEMYLPPISRIRVPVEMADDQAKAYKRMATQFVAWLESQPEIETQAPNVLAKICRLSQITGGFLCGWINDPTADWFTTDEEEGPKIRFIEPFDSNPKLDALAELVENSRKPVVVLARFTHEIRAIEEKLQDYTQATIAGGLTTERQAKILKAFDGGELEVLILQTDSGKYGLNLQTADTLIYFGNSYSYDARGQSEARIHRAGQTKACKIYDIVCEGTIDEAVLQALTSKKRVSDLILKDPAVVHKHEYEILG